MTPQLLRVGLLGGLALLGINGCGGVCGDDGFEWKQDENGVCRPATQTATGTGSTDAATTAVIGSSTGATDPTTGVGTGTGSSSTGTTGDVPGVCGDGQLDPGEACDDGPENGAGKACKADCGANSCGDGDQGPGEQCDNGAMNGDAATCKADCTTNVCGDGAQGPGEGCDDGNAIDDDECTNYSSFPATAPTRQLTSKLHGRNRWVFPRPATGPPTASPRPCPPGLEKARRRAPAWKPGDSVRSA